MTKIGEVAPLIFIGGAPRSGLTLLRLILDAHPTISICPDTGVLSLALAQRDFALTLGELHRDHLNLSPERVSANFAAAIRSILGARAARDGKLRPGEKSAMNVLVFADLASIFPDAQFIHCVRDGRDVVASLLERRWKDPRTGKVFDYCQDAGAAARYWAGLAEIGLRAEQAIGSARIRRVKYEDLVRDPRKSLSTLSDFLAVENTDQPLRFQERALDLAGMEKEERSRLSAPISEAAVGRWRRDLTQRQQSEVIAAAGPALRALGYLLD